MLARCFGNRSRFSIPQRRHNLLFSESVSLQVRSPQVRKTYHTRGLELGEHSNTPPNLEYLLENQATARDLQVIQSVMSDITSVDPNSIVNLNHLPLLKNHPNLIYFSSRDADQERIGKYKRNCAYDNDYWLVVCDAEFVTKVLKHYDLDETTACSIAEENGSCWNTNIVVKQASEQQVGESRDFLIVIVSLPREIGGLITKRLCRNSVSIGLSSSNRSHPATTALDL